MMKTSTTMAGELMTGFVKAKVSLLMGMKEKAMATATRPADIPQAVQRRRRLRPTPSTTIMLIQVMMKFVPATTRPTATGLEKPTIAKSVAE